MNKINAPDVIGILRSELDDQTALGLQPLPFLVRLRTLRQPDDTAGVPFSTLSRHPSQMTGSARSHVKAVQYPHPNNVPVPSIPPQKLSRLWRRYRGGKTFAVGGQL